MVMINKKMKKYLPKGVLISLSLIIGVTVVELSLWKVFDVI
jgi:hypothetical protein